MRVKNKIKQKTKNKILSKILLIFVVFVVIFIFLGIYFSNFNKRQNSFIFYPSIKGCAENKSIDVNVNENPNPLMRIVNIKEEKEPNIEINGNEIVYSRAINHLCCIKVELEKEIRDNIINIYEVWSGFSCRCICFSEIEAKLQNIPKGKYKVNVYEKGTIDEKPIEEKLIISKEISIS